MFENIIFYMFALAVIGGSIAVVFAKNPVYSVISLIFVFFNAAGLFILLGAEFIGLLTVIVYVGAVAVLFLFAVIMLDKEKEVKRSAGKVYQTIIAIMALLLLAEIIIAVIGLLGSEGSLAIANAPSIPIDETISNTESLGLLLYTKYCYVFQFLGVTLLVAMIGAVMLPHRDKKDILRQDISAQIARKADDCIEMVKISSGTGV